MWRRRKREEDLDRELQSHLDLVADEQERNGLTPEEARHAARRVLGSPARVKEEVREMWAWNRLSILLQDIRHALRTLLKSPGFAITAFLTLALGIGASTAVFTLVDSVILKPLAYRDSGRLVTLWERVGIANEEPTGPNPRHADLWQKQTTAFSGMTMVRETSIGVTLGVDHPRVVGTVISTASLFDVLEVTPLLGRTFVPEDDRPGHDNVAVLSYSLWHDLFQGDPNVIGRTLRLGNTRRQVIGVLPRRFLFPNANALRAFPSKQTLASPDEPAIFIPAALDLNRFDWNGEYGNWVVLARLKPAIGIEQAEAQLTIIESRVLRSFTEREYAGKPLHLLPVVQPLQETIAGDSRTGLWLLMAAVMSLMFIACVNLANTQLGRALARQREAAMCAALGADRWRLLWISLSENLILAVVGGAAGVGLAALSLNLFRRYSPVDLPRLSEAHLDVGVLAFSIALIAGACVLFGVLPALRFLHADPQSALQQGGTRVHGTQQGGRLRGGLIGLQVFACTLLLLVTGLFTQSLLRLLHQDRGFETQDVAVAEIHVAGLATDKSLLTMQDGVLRNMRAIPGVRSCGLVSAMPLEGETWIDGIRRTDRAGDETLVNLRWVSPGYFETTGQRLIAGRFLDEHDRNFNVAVISERLAKELWPDKNPVGSEIKARQKTMSIVGIVADSRNASLKTLPPRTLYLHYAENPPNTTVFAARGTQPAAALLPAMREAIWKYSPDITITRVKTLDSQVDDSLARERFQTMTLMSFGIAALLVAMLGIYGVLSYSTATRRQEIGVRIAMGATRRAIYAMTLGGASIPVLGGIVAGLLAAFLARKIIAAQLYGTQAAEPSAALIVVALFLAAALAASFVPAHRAASVDPMDALRSE